MSTSTHHTMINHHGHGFLSAVTETIKTWRERQQSRIELAKWSERDMHDAGISWGEVAAEASKPFWRA
jgi:uncharacterized protein YjiS (DUF1127 family)